jgi:sensor histidine kinase YesM
MFSRYVLLLGQPLNSNIEKIFVWGVAALATVVINLVIIFVMKRVFNKHFDEISRMGKAYPKTERFFIYNSIAILLIMSVAHGGYSLFNGINYALFNAFNLFSLFALIIQFSFLIFIFRITWLKDSLRNTTSENQSLAVYSSNLEKNINDIKNIKHDIKNIFLTMGNFVERSDDLEMQTFYREKINPFASDEIMKSDLYGKLTAIDNEQLKAFLFYKISQAVERGISFDLDISSSFSVAENFMEFYDLVRILGILLDNAIEECMELDSSVIAIKIARNNELISYSIRNTIQFETKWSGVRIGVSSKGSKRGNGLVIVKEIVGKYDFVTLNSYFQDDCFVQNLNLYM